MAQRNSQHETGDRGVKIVLNAAPDHWVDQEQKKDYGIDIKFELFESGRHSGVEFGVQVRSTMVPKFVQNGQFISCRLETDNLDDHLSRRRYPVYLFCVDVAAKEVYWICLQCYAKQITGWKSKKSIVVRVPTNQKLRDPYDFEQQLREDWKLVADMHPGSIPAALKKERDEYAALDSRFQVDIVSDGDRITRVIKLLEPITITAKVKANTPEEASEMINRPNEYGLPTEFEAEFEGSPLLEKLGTAKVQVEPRIDREFDVKVIGFNGLRPLASLDLPGPEVVGGTREFRVETSDTIPILVRSRFYPPDAEEDSQTQWTWSFKPWIGQPISSLSGFDAVCPFATALRHCDALKVVIGKEGTRISSLPTPIEHEKLVNFIEVVERLRLAREIAEHYGVDPDFCLDFDLEDVEILHWLTFDRQQRIVRNLVINDTTAGILKQSQLDQMSDIEEARMRQSAEEIVFDFFGEAIHLGPVAFTYDNIRMHEVTRLPEHISLQADEKVVQFCCTSETTVTVDTHPIIPTRSVC